ncbi:ABC transporter permease [Agrobacterium sp. NPDC090283]|uniref:ABC transporter permease n=1 Tax=Agrobacterium sp. NPDC090283 TaxID=3363920 RepID=UPI00383B3B17
MRSFSLLIFLFLYIPVVVIVVFSFNAAPNVSSFTGFSLSWYLKAYSNPLAMEALLNSTIIAVSTALISTGVGSAVAIGLLGVSKTTRAIVQGSMMIGLAIPGIVIGLASLVFFSSTFSGGERLIAYLAGWPEATKLFSFGKPTVIAAHSLFCTALVVEIVLLRLRQLNPTWLEASSDLYATRSESLRRVVLPFLTPAMMAGGLLSFVLSFDEFIIAFFVSGAKPTLPVYMFASVKRGVTPELNAIATTTLTVSILVSVLAYVMIKRSQYKA